MATQDVGSAFLAGFSAIQGMNQQRRDNEFRNRQQDEIERANLEAEQFKDRQQTEIERSNLKTEEYNSQIAAIKEKEEARLQNVQDRQIKVEKANSSIELFSAAGLVNKDFTGIDKAKFNEGIANGDAAVLDIGLQQINANAEKMLGPGLTATGIVPAPDGSGRYAVTVRTAEGVDSAITENRTADAQDNVVFFDPEKLTNLVDLSYRKTAGDASSVNITRIVQEQNVVGADANAAETERDALDGLEANAQLADIIDVVAATGDQKAMSGVLDLLASGASFEDFQNVLSTVQQDIDPEDDTVGQGIERKIQTNIADVQVGERTTFEEGGARAQAEETVLAAADEGWRFYKTADSMRGDIERANIDKNLIDPTTKRSFGVQMEEFDAEVAALKERFASGKIGGEQYDNEIDKVEKDRNRVLDRANKASVKKIRDLESRRDALIERDLMEEAQNIQNQIDEEVGTKYTTAGLVKLTKDLEGKSDQQIDEEIDSGKIKIDPQTLKDAAEQLRQKGIKDLKDTRLANTKDRAMMRAVLAANEPDASNRKAIRSSIDNLFSTGDPTLSTNQAQTNQINQEKNRIAVRKLNQEAKQWREGQYESLNEDLDTFYTGVNKVVFGDDFKENYVGKGTSNGLVRQFLPTVLARIRNTEDPQVRDEWTRAFGALISTTVAGYAQDNDAGWVGNIAAWFRPNAKDSIQSTDFEIEKVRPVYSSKGKVTGYEYTDQYGRSTDSVIKAGNLRKLDAKVEDALRAVVTQRHPFTGKK